MVKAVAQRPPEEFEIEVEMPDWQVDGEEEAWTGEPDNFLMVDPDGNPVEPDAAAPPPVRREPVPVEPAPREDESGDETLSQEWLDRAVGRTRPPPPPREPPPPRRKSSADPADPVERRPLAL